MTDPTPGFRNELNDALSILNPQITGLELISRAPISPEAQAIVATQTDVRKHRRDLIGGVLSAMDTVITTINALVADGYPALPSETVLKPVFDELQTEMHAVEQAVSIFVFMPVAIKSDLSGVVYAPQPKPDH